MRVRRGLYPQPGTRYRLAPMVAAVFLATAVLPSFLSSATLAPLGPAATAFLWMALSPPETARAGRELKKAESADRVCLDYAWRGPEGSPLSVSVSISRTDLEESERAFGYVKAELETDLLAREAALRQEEALSPMAAARRLIARSPFAEFIEARESEGGEVALVVPEGRPIPAGAGAEVERLSGRLASAWAASKRKIAAILRKRVESYFEAHGLVRVDEGIGVRYDALVRRSLPLVGPIARELKAMSDRELHGRDLEAVLSFVQQIPVAQVPEEENGRYTTGCRVPLAVLADDGGDCDSKAVLFTALWRCLHNFPAVLVMVPEHMLVGVAGSFGDGASVALDSHRFLLCEVCSRKPVPPGSISEYSAKSIARGQVRYKILGPR